MIQRYSHALAVTLLVLIVTACAGQQTVAPEELAASIKAAVAATIAAQPTPTMREVEVTRQVTVEVTRVVTEVVTATPVPTPTAEPAPRPTAKPTPDIPPGWKTYTFIQGGGSICYPPDWTVTGERKTAVTISQQDLVYVIVSELPAVLSGTNAEAKLAYLKSNILDSVSDLDTVVFVAERVLEDVAFEPAMVVAQIEHYAYDDVTSHIISSFSQDGGKMVLIDLFVLGADNTLGTEGARDAGRVVANMILCYQAGG